MRVRVVGLIALLGGCGRIGFDAGTDASPDPDAVRVPYAEVVLADQPRAYYRLGEAIPTTVRDIAGAADDAKLMGSNGGVFELGRPGALPGDPDTAIRFLADGNAGPRLDAWAQLPAVWSTWAGDFTIEVFVRPLTGPPPGYSHSILLCEHYLNNGFRTGWDDGLNLGMWSTQDGATGSVEASTVMTIGAWHHLAFIKRGATVEIFLGAQLAASAVFDYLAPSAMAVCGFGSFHGMPSDCELDELAIYEVALTPTQLAAHVAAARP